MGTPLTGIAGFVNADGTLPKPPSGTRLQYTCKIIEGNIYEIAYNTSFKQPPCVLVTPLTHRVAGANPSILASPIVLESLFDLCTIGFVGVPSSISEQPFILTPFYFVALDLTTT